MSASAEATRQPLDIHDEEVQLTPVLSMSEGSRRRFNDDDGCSGLGAAGMRASGTKQRRLWRRLARQGAAGLVLTSVLASPSVAASTKAEPSARQDLATVRGATARYHSVERAERDGYSPITGCIASPGVGAMGIHYANDELMNDGVLDPNRPEILLYMPEGKKLRLVGVEYWSPDGDQDAGTDEDRPVLFDQPFMGPMAGHVPGMPIHYDLHVWVWRTNPAGVFEPYNSALRCPDPAPSGTTH